MSDELRAAANEIITAWESRPREYEPTTKFIAAKWLAEAYIAEHPADDDYQVEFGTAYEHGDVRIDCCACSVAQSCLIIYDTRRGGSYLFRIWTQPAMPTRRDVRRLLAALGIEVTK